MLLTADTIRRRISTCRGIKLLNKIALPSPRVHTNVCIPRFSRRTTKPRVELHIHAHAHPRRKTPSPSTKRRVTSTSCEVCMHACMSSLIKEEHTKELLRGLAQFNVYVASCHTTSRFKDAPPKHTHNAGGDPPGTWQSNLPRDFFP